MRRVSLIAALAALIAVAIPAVASAKVTKLKFTEVDAQSNFVDNPPTQSTPNAPPSPGDMFMDTGILKRGSRTVGHTYTWGIVIDATHAIITGSAVLPRGHVVVSDVVDFTKQKTTFSIIGGTGAYKNARGEITTTDINDTTSRDLVTIIT